MREIKFRAWDGKQMHENVVIIDGTAYKRGYFATFLKDEAKAGISMQYTGLKDKNGVDVYEGDIVKCSSGCPHTVQWVSEYGGTFLGGMPAFYMSGLTSGYAWTGDEEVIGNVHESPNLLQQPTG